MCIEKIPRIRRVWGRMVVCAETERKPLTPSMTEANRTQRKKCLVS